MTKRFATLFMGATALTAGIAAASNAMPDLPHTVFVDIGGDPSYLTELGATNVGRLDFPADAGNLEWVASLEYIDQDGIVMKLSGALDSEPTVASTIMFASAGLFDLSPQTANLVEALTLRMDDTPAVDVKTVHWHEFGALAVVAGNKFLTDARLYLRRALSHMDRFAVAPQGNTSFLAA